MPIETLLIVNAITICLFATYVTASLIVNAERWWEVVLTLFCFFLPAMFIAAVNFLFFISYTEYMK